MAEEMTNETMEQDYVAAIEEMKRNTVSRDMFDKMKAENKKLLNALTNGQEIVQEKIQETKKDVSELAANVLRGGKNNLDYISAALELRARMIEEGMEDPFVPHGKKISPTREDYESAERVANAFQSCIDYADGDSEIFTQELQRITKDTAMPRKRR